jgi:hypothetical protein
MQTPFIATDVSLADLPGMKNLLRGPCLTSRAKLHRNVHFVTNFFSSHNFKLCCGVHFLGHVYTICLILITKFWCDNLHKYSVTLGTYTNTPITKMLVAESILRSSSNVQPHQTGHPMMLATSKHT